MELLLRNVYFVFEDIQITDVFKKFSLFLKLENYEWTTAGEYFKQDLPIGVSFPILIGHSWFDSPEVEVRVESDDKKYEGILEIITDNTKHSATGRAVLYENERQMNTMTIQCTILIEEVRGRESVESRETQTVDIRTKEYGCQTNIEQTKQGVAMGINTDEWSIDLSDIEKTLQESVENKLRELWKKEEKKDEEERIEDPKPSENTRQEGQNTLNTYNIVPRLTKLRDLDAMITEKTKILMELDKDMEVRRKMRKVMDERKNMKKKEESKEEKEESDEDEDSSDESTTTSSTESSSSSSSSTSSSSSPSTPKPSQPSKSVTIVQTNQPTIKPFIVPPQSLNQSSSSSSNGMKLDNFEELAVDADLDNIDSSIEDPFTTRKSTVSPVGEYLENLKKKVLDQYNSRYNS